MSLAQLRQVRRGNHRPPSVTVVIGRAPAWITDGPGFVQIDCDPHDLDLRPLVGLPVHVLDLQEDRRLTLHVIAALEDLKVSPVGICGPAGSCGVSPEHEAAMTRYRELLCTE